MRKSIRTIAAKSILSVPLAFLMVVLISSTGVLAQQTANEAGAWQFGASIYGWFPNIAGETSFRQPGGGNDFQIDIEDILDNLEFTLMGTFDVRKGRWGLFTDLIYMNVGGSETGTREASIGRRELPVNATADVDLDLKSWICVHAGHPLEYWFIYEVIFYMVTACHGKRA